MAEPTDPRTLSVTAGRPERTPDAPLNTPIVAASSFIAGGPIGYAREQSPTSQAFEEVVGALEGGTAVAFASGMAAANAALDLVPMGGVVVAPLNAYSAIAARLRELDAIGRISLRRVPIDDAEAVSRACQGAFLLWLESPTNPLLEVADLAACCASAKRHGALVLVDNTFATPILQQPIAAGADLVLHSATKALSGHSDVIIGVLVVADQAMHTQVRSRRVLLGGNPSAFDCFLALRGVRTLALRVERGQENAQLLSARLREHPAVSRVRYPGWGSMASIEVVGDADTADRVCDRTRIWANATSLGGVESLLERRRRWPLESTEVPQTLIRLSFGIEAADDLWRDLSQALSAATH